MSQSIFSNGTAEVHSHPLELGHAGCKAVVLFKKLSGSFSEQTIPVSITGMFWELNSVFVYACEITWCIWTTLECVSTSILLTTMKVLSVCVLAWLSTVSILITNVCYESTVCYDNLGWLLCLTPLQHPLPLLSLHRIPPVSLCSLPWLYGVNLYCFIFVDSDAVIIASGKPYKTFHLK